MLGLKRFDCLDGLKTHLYDLVDKPDNILRVIQLGWMIYYATSFISPVSQLFLESGENFASERSH